MKEKFIVCNAFSLQMLNGVQNVKFIEVSQDEVKELLKSASFESAIGHADTANVLSDLLEVPIEMNRQNIQLEVNTTLIVAQLQGGRLPEGTTSLPEGFEFKFFKVSPIAEWAIRYFGVNDKGAKDDFFRGTLSQFKNVYLPTGKDARVSCNCGKRIYDFNLVNNGLTEA